MTIGKRVKVTRLLPPNGEENIINLYLKPPLLSEIAEKLSRTIFITDYVTDINGVIATKNKNGIFIPPPQITNPYDWRLFQELMAQADATTISGKYLTGYAKGRTTQNILTQFESGEKFSDLGDWRLKHGYDNKGPDLVVPSRSLNFTIPEFLIESKRKILIYTLSSMINSQEAKALRASGANLKIIDAGNKEGTGVDGKKMIGNLQSKNYRILTTASGPIILQILLNAGMLDRIHITEVQREVAEKNFQNLRKLLTTREKVGSLPGFSLVQKYEQRGVKMDDGEKATQHFLIFESDQFKSEREKHSIPI